MTSLALIRLLHLCDSTLPVGAFSHSAGLETYVQLGKVHDVASAETFITAMLSRSIHYTDAAFVSLAYEAADNDNLPKLFEWDQHCSAVKLTAETRTASKKMGQRLWKIFRDGETLGENRLLDQSLKFPELNYCVVFGAIARVSGITKAEALQGFYYNALAAMVTNCVKLIPLGQQQGQQLIFRLMPLLAELAEQNLQPDESQLGLCCPAFDIRSMQHERLYSRLYMS